MEITGFDAKAKKCDCCGRSDMIGAVILSNGEEEFRYSMQCASFATGIPSATINTRYRREVLGIKRDRPINIWTH